ncbi:AAA family ATPase [Streptomyces canus]|uniref:AAA family ATPase n=1 Tax=Streptomyces canus TaxID=58343 RepID=UPI00278595A4|nr:ABC-type multidrug transport system ATPase subunit [Streptomyces canus]
MDAVLATVGLTDVARKRAGGFSLGMSQRLGIAAALLGDPAVLLFDEPVNGLDPEGVRWIRTLMKSLAAEGRTVLLSSHLISEMALTADHLIVIGRGRLLADTSVGELTAHGRSLEGQARPAELRGREPEGAGRSAVSGGLNARSEYRISTTSVLVWTCQSSAARLCRATLRALSGNSAVPPPPRWNDEGQSP